MPWLTAALVLHIALGLVGDEVLPYFFPDPKLQRGKPIQLVVVPPPAEDEEEEEEEEEEDKDLDGQIVEVAPPEEEMEEPEDAEYLAEANNIVEEETRTEQFMVNPEVLAREFSRDMKAQQEDLVDLDVDKPSTGATVGNDRFDPDRDGSLANLPSPWTLTNKEGLEDPVPASFTEAQLSGAPQNDLLDEKRGDAVNLNTKEFLYASYINRIRRLVNFYWEQNLDNLPSSVRLAKPKYSTSVDAVLNSDGALEYIEVVEESGSGPLDDCVVRAFKIAGPFPHPPEGLIEKDGRVYLPHMSFTVVLGVAQSRYDGIDPRAGVQFPGILKNPR